MTDMEQREERRDSAKLFLQLAMTLLLTAILGVNGWALIEVSNLGKQVAENTSRLEDWGQTGTPHLSNQVAINTAAIANFIQQGPRYSRDDADRDLGVVMNLLERQGKELDDHEGRIRVLERAK